MFCMRPQCSKDLNCSQLLYLLFLLLIRIVLYFVLLIISKSIVEHIVDKDIAINISCNVI